MCQQPAVTEATTDTDNYLLPSEGVEGIELLESFGRVTHNNSTRWHVSVEWTVKNEKEEKLARMKEGRRGVENKPKKCL